MSDVSDPDLSSEFTRLTADLLDQSMAKIRHCLGQLNEDRIWWRPEPSMNSIGNLLLHLEGNLRQWGVIPFTLADDKRDRGSEFETKNQGTSRELIGMLESVVTEAKEQWQSLKSDQLSRKIEIQGFQVTQMQAILHTSSHFVGHAHQVIQLTRMQQGPNYQFHWSPNQEPGDLPI